MPFGFVKKAVGSVFKGAKRFAGPILGTLGTSIAGPFGGAIGGAAGNFLTQGIFGGPGGLSAHDALVAQQTEARKDRTLAREQLRSAQDFSAKQLRRQQDFAVDEFPSEIHAANVRGLRKAGLNPILAASGGIQSPSQGTNATSPSGSTPSSSLSIQESKAKLLAARAQSQLAFNAASKLKAETANIEADTRLKDAGTASTEADVPLKQSKTALNDAEVKRVYADAKLKIRQRGLVIEQTNKARQEIKNLQQTFKLTKAQTTEIILKYPELIAVGNAWKSKRGAIAADLKILGGPKTREIATIAQELKRIFGR